MTKKKTASFSCTFQVPDVVALEFKLAKGAVDAAEDAAEDVHGVLLDPANDRVLNEL